MQLIDYLIVIVPLVLLIALAFYSARYIRGVVDFLAAGRVAGRYVLCVGDMAAGLAVMSLVAGAEQNYQTGYSVGFWGAVSSPIAIFMALSGYCVYRWRETRCLSIGQFLELRYGSKFFRIFCATLRTIAEMMTNAISPAVAANFFIYYLGLPHRIMICGVNLPCYVILVGMCLALAVLFIWPSGRISLLITDSVQGLISYPIFVIIVGYIILNFSWFDEIAPVMWNRVEGQSFMSPYDISDLRDFNIFAIMVTVFGNIINRASWIGNDTTGAAITPHEQKMAGVIGALRNGFAWVMIMLVAILTITFMNHPGFMRENRFGFTSFEVREQLTAKVLENTLPDADARTRIVRRLKDIPAQERAAAEAYRNGETRSAEKLAAVRAPRHPEAYRGLMAEALAERAAGRPVPVEVRDTLELPPLSQQQNPDTPYMQTIRQELGDTPEGRHRFQRCRTLYHQMMMPTVLSKIFPVGLLGLFCLLMVMLLISTDDSRIFNAASTLVQDVVLPFFRRRVESGEHILLLRLMSIGVAVFFFIVSVFFAQIDYIQMYCNIMCSLWTGAAGPIMVFGLYSRFGNLRGAWTAIILGSGTSLSGMILQRTWATSVYPFFERMDWVAGLDRFLRAVSSPFHPWITWSMNPVKFPINSFEIYGLSMVLAIGGYILMSYLTYRPYDLDKLLHRGKYADEFSASLKQEGWSVGRVFRILIGITPEYSRGDKVMAWSVFSYSFVYRFGLCFVVIVIWNLFQPWPHEWWTIKFFITSLAVPGIVGCITTVWFLIGGTYGIFELFRNLEKRKVDPNDNGQILQEK